MLAGALGDVLAVPLADPMQPEVVSVPTRGVERWLTQRLAHRLGTSSATTDGGRRGDGVCANLEFPFPGHLVGDAMAVACGVDRDHDPWRPERAVWPLLDLIDQRITEPWLATLASHLGANDDGELDEVRRSRRFATARHITDLFDRYGVHRPAMVRAWAATDDVTAAGAPLPAAHRWQAELWRELRARIASASPAERLGDACARLIDEPELSELPPRLAIFGLTRLPASYLDVLRALSHHRDVHLFLLHPSAALWSAVAGVTAGAGAIQRRALDPTADVPTNPVLRSWGRDAREMQLVLTSGPDGDDVVDHHHPLEATTPASLLQRIQQAVRDDTPPPGEPGPAEPDARPLLDDGDRSLQVHACHGKSRQVEVLRDAILHLLVDDPTLEPRDVIVMCPDIETFAPLIHATFGSADAESADPAEAASASTDDAHPTDLRVRLADRSLRQTNPILGAASALLALAGSRVTSTHVLDFAGRDPVRRRFEFDDDELARIKEWVAATGVRWGLDAAHRAPFQLQQLEQNTWRAGLDRVLVGVAVAEREQALVDGVLPLDDVESGAIDLAGRFAELIDRLHAAVTALQGAKTLAGWVTAINDAAAALFATVERDAWQRIQLHRMLDDLVEEASTDSDASGVELSLAELRSLLADRLRGRPTRANFRTGHLTVCTLVPMRSVPHRVVCLLGLDDAAFPRKSDRDGDDLIAAEPFVGDGDGRSEDRQLLLDALLAAHERLVITYSGNDDRTNAPLPPAVPVGELLDLIDATVRVGADGARPREQVVVHHPLQPFDPRNFEPGRLRRDGPWSFDAVTLEGARALLGDRPLRGSFLSGPLPPAAHDEVIELDSLVRFVQHPAKAFLRNRLGISLGDFSDDIGDTIPIQLDGLEKWNVGDRVLAARLAGASPEACEQAERARGDLPPANLAGSVFAEIGVTVEQIVEEAIAVTGKSTDVDSTEVAVRLDDGRLVVGTVPGVVGRFARLVTYSRVAAKHRLASWVKFLALTAAHPDEEYEAVTVGRSQKPGKVAIARFPAMSAGPAAERAARLLLHDLVELYDRGMREPVPLYCVTSGAYVEALRSLKDARSAASKEWETTDPRFEKEDRNLEHQLIFGSSVAFDALLEAAPCAGEDGDGWDADETTRFGRYAMRLWSPLLDHEVKEDK